jgi:DNA-binding MarR family transcriptional regulator
MPPTPRSPAPSPRRYPVDAQRVEAVLAGSRLVGGIIAESLATLEPPLTVPQWRVLVLAGDEGCNVSAVAADLGVHRSNATRTCNRLVAAGLLERRRVERDLRQVLMVLTPAGRHLFETAMEFRRRRIEAVMQLLPVEDQQELARTVALLVEAAGRAQADR